MSVPSNKKRFASGIFVLILAGAAVGAYVLRADWMPSLSQKLMQLSGTTAQAAEHNDDEHGHDDHGAVDPNSIEVSDQARSSIGLETRAVELQTFERALSVPGTVEQQPGKTEIQVAAPMTALVTEVGVITGEAIASGRLLFRLRPTHEDLVDAQTRFIQNVGELDVELAEIERLTGITKGAVAGKVILEREYAKKKLEATQSALREALLLHGLTNDQIDSIVKERKLVREIEVYAPLAEEKVEPNGLPAEAAQPADAQNAKPDSSSASRGTTPLIVQELRIHKGQSVQAGETLAQLANFGNLYIRGDAFDRDSEALLQAASNGWPVVATIERDKSKVETVSGLKIHYVANEIDTDTRALHFYVKLPNSPVQDAVGSDGHRFVSWKFRPGQRVQLRVPVEQWKEQLVVPVTAVAQDGVENYVFAENGNKFVRQKVNVKFRDSLYAVIENDGSIFPGDVIAFTGANQLQLAIKNKTGGAIDPHAGHHH